MMLWLLVLLGYIIGTCPTAYILGKKLRGFDIRQMGDRNMGARNAYFEIGHAAGIIIGLIDGTKGLLAVLISMWADASQTVVLATGLAVVLGHNFPLFLGFRGGRGQATTIGVLFGLVPVPMLIVSTLALLSLLVCKNMILSSAVLFIGLPVVGWLLQTSGLLILYGIGLACLVGLTHFFRVWRLEKPAGTI
jgi:glycerol-3-phosphate acyltransferase PlsY